MTLDEFLQKNFEFFQHPEQWYGKAVRLRRAANYLYKATLPDIHRYELARRQAEKALVKSGKQVVTIRCREPEVLPIVALHGLALENVFKALIVSRDLTVISPTKISKRLQDHRLAHLAKLAGIPLSNYEEQILGWVSEVVIWKGRYPLPLMIEHLGAFLAFDHTIADHIKSHNRTIDVVFNRAVEALRPSLAKSRLRYPVLVQT